MSIETDGSIQGALHAAEIAAADGDLDVAEEAALKALAQIRKERDGE